MNTWVKLKNISDGKAILVIGKCREKLQAWPMSLISR
jgi:hypothetical protein